MKKRNIIFILVIYTILCYPILGYFIDKNVSLNGVVKENEVNINVSDALDGTAQTKLNDYYESNFWGRKGLIKLRSQLLYSVFDMSPNSNVVIGKNKYLYEPEYICKELNIYPTVSDEYIDDLMNKLLRVEEKCEENGKELYIFITPSKAFFCRNKIPTKYTILSNDGVNNYDKFIGSLNTSGLKFFDSHEYIIENNTNFPFPVFYSSGIHWSRPWGERCAIAFLDYIDNASKWDLSDVEQTVSHVSTPVSPDDDLYSSLNLISNPREEYYSSEISIVNRKQVPKAFYRGGSFMGQSLSALGNVGVFDVRAHYENSYCFLENYSGVVNTSSFDSYGECDCLVDRFRESDIIILEVNECAIPVMSWGFIDYILENDEFWEN